MTDKPWPQEWCGPNINITVKGNCGKVHSSFKEWQLCHACGPVYAAVDHASEGDTTVIYTIQNGDYCVMDITQHWNAPNRLRGAYVNDRGEAV